MGVGIAGLKGACIYINLALLKVVYMYSCLSYSQWSHNTLEGTLAIQVMDIVSSLQGGQVGVILGHVNCLHFATVAHICLLYL